MIKYLTILLIIISFGCSNRKKEYEFTNENAVIFLEDPTEKDISFEPTISEVENTEIALQNYLKNKISDTVKFTKNGNQLPTSDRLVYYKRRYFGRINTENEKVIKVEYIFNRCMSPQERDLEKWKDFDFKKNIDSSCWFSFQYNLNRKEIYGLI